MSEYKYVVSEDENKLRVDKLLAELYPEYSRTFIQKLIEQKDILVNDEATKANYLVRTGDILFINEIVPVELDLTPENLNLDIVYEDDDVVVVNKPKNMVVHPANGVVSKTLVNGLLYQVKNLSTINSVLRPGIVHRIDKDTTGLLMVAKNDEAHRSLVEQLKEKSVTRKYIALVEGIIPHDFGEIDAPIGRDMRDRIKMAVREDGKHAVTHFKVLERFIDKTLVECVLDTGRTHQIRVHMQYINHPVFGDNLYGRRRTNTELGQYLHAQVLGFIHPRTKEYLEFSAPLPAYFTEYLEKLRDECNEKRKQSPSN